MENSMLCLPEKVFAGPGSILRVRELIEGKYSHIVLYTDQGVSKAGLINQVLDTISLCGINVTVVDDLPAEPDEEAAQRIVDQFRREPGDYIIGVGGGSVIDMAKLVSITAGITASIRDLLETPSLGRKTVKTLLIPTTAGTGAEATPNSIVAVPEQHVKIGIVNMEMMGDAVILDGTMLRNMPEKLAAATAADALAHAVECFTSVKATSFSNLFAKEAFRLIMKYAVRACICKDDMEAKSQMLLAAFYAGAAITSSGTTAVHALSYPLGGIFHIPHGVANAILLMPVMRFNWDACTKELAQLYDVIEHKPNLPIPSDKEKSILVLDQMKALLSQLPLPDSLEKLGVRADDLESLIKAGLNGKRLLDNNKKPVTYEDAKAIYLQIM